nr:uncharacterized protein LOC108075817 [Drosophila kikkawai]
MAPNWAFLFVIFTLLGIGLSLRPLCPNNTKYQCVPTPYCPRDLRSITAYRCSSRNEACCDEQKVLFGVRYTGKKYISGPYSQA